MICLASLSHYVIDISAELICLHNLKAHAYGTKTTFVGGHSRDTQGSLYLFCVSYRSQTTVENCNGGHVNVLSDYKKT